MTMMTWGLSVVELGDGDRWAVAVAEAADAAQYEALATRFRQAGLKRTSAREWNGGLWPVTTCSVTVEAGHLTQAHTGRSRVLCSPAPDVTPRWEKAGGRGRIVLGLVRPGTLPNIGTRGGILHQEHVDLAAEQIEEAAVAGHLLAGLATLLDRPAPVPGGRR